MSTRRHPHIVHRDEIEPTAIEQGKHRLVRRSFTTAAGNRQLGGSLIEIAPGAIGFPQHYHCANEEAVYIVSGSGIARIGDDRVPVRAGDWIAYPIGPAYAHQMINDSDAPLVYLAISTDLKCEVIGYPDSKKVAAFGGDNWDHPWVAERVRAAAPLAYWDGEPDA